MALGLALGLWGRHNGGLSITIGTAIAADATGTLATLTLTAPADWPASQMWLDPNTGVTWTATRTGAQTASLTATGLAAGYADVFTPDTRSVAIRFLTAAGGIVTVRATILGVQVAVLELLAGDLPAAGSVIEEGGQIAFTAGLLGAAPLTVEPGYEFTVAAGAAGEKILRNDAAGGELMEIAMVGGGLVIVGPGSSAGEFTASIVVGAYSASATVSVAGSPGAFYRFAAYLSEADGLGVITIADEGGTHDSDSVALTGYTPQNVETIRLFGGASRTVTTTIPAFNIAIIGCLRVDATGAVAAVVSATAPLIIVAADTLDAASVATLLATVPVASDTPTMTAATVEAAVAGAAVGVAQSDDISAAITGIAPLSLLGLSGMTLTGGVYAGTPTSAGPATLRLIDARGVEAATTAAVTVLPAAMAEPVLTAGVLSATLQLAGSVHPVEWIVTSGTAGGPTVSTATTAAGASSTPINLTGLTAGTLYFARSREIIDGTPAPWSSWSDSATPVAAPAVPSQIGGSKWAAYDVGDGTSAYVVLRSAPSNNGAAITGYEYRVNGGSTLTLPGGAMLGRRRITGLSLGGTSNIDIRAVNSVGAGTFSGSKSVVAAVPTLAYMPPVEADDARQDDIATFIGAGQRIVGAGTDTAAINASNRINRVFATAAGGDVEILNGAGSDWAVADGLPPDAAKLAATPLEDQGLLRGVVGRIFDPQGIGFGGSAGAITAHAATARVRTDVGSQMQSLFATISTSQWVQSTPGVFTLTGGTSGHRVRYTLPSGFLPNGSQVRLSCRVQNTGGAAGRLRLRVRNNSSSATILDPDSYQTINAGATITLDTDFTITLADFYNQLEIGTDSGTTLLTTAVMDQITLTALVAPINLDVAMALSSVVPTGATTWPARSAVGWAAVSSDWRAGAEAVFRFARTTQIGRHPDGRPFAVGPLEILRRDAAPLSLAPASGSPLIIERNGARLSVLHANDVGLIVPDTQTPAHVINEAVYTVAPSPVAAFDSTGSTAGGAGLMVLETTPERISIYLDAASGGTAQVRFRKTGDTPWIAAQPLHFDAGTQTSATFSRPWRGMIGWLRPGDSYDVQVLHAGVLHSGTAVTKARGVTVAETRAIPAGGGTLTDSGTAGGNIVYEGGVARGSITLASGVSYVEFRGVTFRANSGAPCVDLLGSNTFVRFVGCDFGGWGPDDYGADAGTKDGVGIGWGTSRSGAVRSNNTTATGINNLQIMGCRFGTPRTRANTWEEYNPQYSDADPSDYPTLANGYEASIHPQGPAGIAIGRGGGRGNHWTDNSFSPLPWRNYDDAVLGGSSSSANANRGIPGDDADFLFNYGRYAADDVFQIEGQTINLWAAGNWVDMEPCRPADPYRQAPKSAFGLTTPNIGPSRVERNIVRSAQPSFENAWHYKLGSASSNLRQVFGLNNTSFVASGIAPDRIWRDPDTTTIRRLTIINGVEDADRVMSFDAANTTITTTVIATDTMPTFEASFAPFPAAADAVAKGAGTTLANVTDGGLFAAWNGDPSRGALEARS